MTRDPREASDGPEDEGTLLVLCGPSGVGKGTLMHRLVEKCGTRLCVAVSHTTRKPREGEQDGTHYFFVTHDEFRTMLDAGGFLEYAEIHGKLYGTSKAAVATASSKGRVCVLEIDVKGAQSIRSSGAKARYVFVTASGGIDVLEARLRGRGTESAEKIARRMQTSKAELSFLEANPHFFDKVIVNDDLETATCELDEALRLWFPCLVSR